MREKKRKEKEKGQGCEKGRAAGLLRCCCGTSVTQFNKVVLLCKLCPADVKLSMSFGTLKHFSKIELLLWVLRKIFP